MGAMFIELKSYNERISIVCLKKEIVVHKYRKQNKKNEVTAIFAYLPTTKHTVPFIKQGYVLFESTCQRATFPQQCPNFTCLNRRELAES
jgi:hypothetical protein